MKKNKTIAYMLAATLLVGGTFVGTKALFTDRVDTVGELKISTGDVDIEVTADSQWELSRNGSELKEGTNIEDQLGTTDELLKSDFAPSNDSNNKDTVPTDSEGNQTPFANNLKPGDKLEKIVRVKNVGTLNARLSLDSNNVSEKLGDLKDFIKVEESDFEYPKGDNGILKPGRSATIVLKLTVDQEKEYVHDKESVNSDRQEDAIVDLTNAWVLTATQTTN